MSREDTHARDERDDESAGERLTAKRGARLPPKPGSPGSSGVFWSVPGW